MLEYIIVITAILVVIAPELHFYNKKIEKQKDQHENLKKKVYKPLDNEIGQIIPKIICASNKYD